ncbi:MAG: diguanylate cyclase, partial [Desulfobacterales bacterium]|nr:diguanylate cyclase [Desulfobacterales bacterium]
NAKDILHLEKGSEHNSINEIVKILLGSALDKRKKEIFLEATNTNNTETHENDIRFKFEKEVFYYNIKLIPVFDKFRRVIGKILVLNDITLRKKKERRLHYQSYHDSLTNIYNRSYFEEEIKRMDTERQFPISIIIGDINGLKLVNDTFGHIEGDKLIKNIAKILKKNLRHEDVLSRWGGDEFAIILPKTTSKYANNIMKRIKENCKKVRINVMPVSISLGTATKTRKTENIINVVREAENIMYEYKLSEDKSARSSIISSLQKALEERDFETEEHSIRMAQLSVLIGKRIKLDENKLNELKLLAALHDIGKISITDSIILKPGKLTTSEWKQVKKHPEVGYRIAQSSSDLSRISLGILHHHERWDGNGYPDGLKGENIPLISRIIAIVDAYDAMTNNRPYREAISKKEASIEIKKCAGKQFDPKISLQFLKIIGQ